MKKEINYLLKKSDFNGARRALEENFRPTDPFYLGVDAYIEAEIGNANTALMKYERAIKFSSNRLPVTLNFFFFLTKLQKWKEATDLLSRWSRVASVAPFIPLLASNIIKSDNFLGAEIFSALPELEIDPLIQCAISISDGTPVPCGLSHNIYLKLLEICIASKKTSAVVDVAKNLEASDTNYQALLAVSKFLLDSYLISESHNVLERLKPVKPIGEIFLKLYLKVLFKRGKYLEAVALLLHEKKSENSLIKNETLFHFLALSYHYSGDNTQARKYMLYAARLQPHYIPSLVNLASFQHLTNKRAAALSTLSRINRLAIAAHDVPSSRAHDIIKASVIRDLCQFVECRKLFSKHTSDHVSWVKYLFSLGYDTEISSAEIFEIYHNYSHSLEDVEQDLVDFNTKNIVFVSGDVNKSSMSNYLLPMCEAINLYTEYDPIIIYTGTQKDQVTQKYIEVGIRVLHAPLAGVSSLLTVIGNIKPYAIIDMCGISRHSRPELFLATNVRRTISSPLAHAFSSGNKGIRFFLGNSSLVSELEKEHFPETILEFPGYPAVFKPIRDVQVRNRVADKHAIRFGVLSRSIRVNDYMIRIWSNILRAMHGAKIVFASTEVSDGLIKKRIVQEFSKHGILLDSLIFSILPLEESLAEIDIVLDMAPHSSGTTVSESLAFGVPVVALQGPLVFGKICSSILTDSGLSHLVAPDEVEYLKIIEDLAASMHGNIEFRNDFSRDFFRSKHCDLKSFASSFVKSLEQIDVRKYG